MYIFILSILVVSFIALCFYKNKFWGNRYLVLLIGGSVALVATLTINYITRNDLDTKVTTNKLKPISLFYVNDSLVLDSVGVPIVLNSSSNIGDYYVTTEDTITDKIKTSFLFYNIDKTKSKWKFVYYDTKKDKLKYKYWNNIYIVPSNSENKTFYAKKTLSYDRNSNKWITNFSLPNIKRINVFYVRPSDYAMIPDSLIKELPFKL
jgi:hypothetical protein